jgi:hypothetical protein
MAWKPALPRRDRWILCVFLLVLAGCREQEQIHSYLAPKESLPEPPSTRMLAVMVPRDKDVWFFKFIGRKKDVTEHEDEFETFVRSVRFPKQGETPITWTTPPGWRREMGQGITYATLRLGPKGGSLDITITMLGPEAADVRPNVDRWRAQLSLQPMTDARFHQVHNNTEVDGVKATRVDLVGVLQPKAGPMAQPPRGRAREDRPPLRYDTPKGWEARPPMVKRGIRIPVVLRVAQDGQEAETTGMSLPGDGGGLIANVQRWRAQVGLGPIEEAELRRNVRTVKVGDSEAQCVDLGPGQNTKQRILGAMLPHGKETWFFTLKGPADLVGKQQANFEAFVASVRFGNEPGAAHE